MFVEPPRAYKKHWKRSEAVWTTRCRRPLDKTPVPCRVAMSFLKSFFFFFFFFFFLNRTTSDYMHNREEQSYRTAG